MFSSLIKIHGHTVQFYEGLLTESAAWRPKLDEAFGRLDPRSVS